MLTAPRRARLPEKLLGSEAKVKLLILFRENPMLEADVDELARRIGMNRETLVHDLADLAELGLLRRREVFSLDPLKDHELQATMSQAIETGGLRNEVVDLSREAEPVGLPLLDRLLPSGLPDSASIMLGADPVSGVFELCLQVAIQWLRKGRSVVYITTHRSPEEVRDALLTLGTEAPQYEEREQLAIVDSYWYLAGVKSTAKYRATTTSLSGISIACSDALGGVVPGRRLVILNSLTPLIHRFGPLPVLEFVQVINAKTKQFGDLVLHTISRGAFEPTVLAGLYGLSDGIIEMRAEETEEGVGTDLRVTKMPGMIHSTRWVPYVIDPLVGVVPPPSH